MKYAYYNGLKIKDILEYTNFLEWGLEVLVEFEDESTIWTEYDKIVIE